MKKICSTLRNKACHSGMKFVLLTLLLGFCCLMVSQTAEAQFFQPAKPPQIGDLPAPNAGVQAQNQGYFMKDWYKQGRYSPPAAGGQGSAFNPPPWGGPPAR